MKGLYLFQRYLPFIDIMWLFFIRLSGVISYFPHTQFFIGQMGVILTETGCRRVEYANGGL
jgi:hypothetical protein